MLSRDSQHENEIIDIFVIFERNVTKLVTNDYHTIQKTIVSLLVCHVTTNMKTRLVCTT